MTLARDTLASSAAKVASLLYPLPLRGLWLGPTPVPAPPPPHASETRARLSSGSIRGEPGGGIGSVSLRPGKRGGVEDGLGGPC